MTTPRGSFVATPTSPVLYSYMTKVIETTKLFSLFSLFWMNLEAHGFHFFLTVL